MSCLVVLYRLVSSCAKFGFAGVVASFTPTRHHSCARCKVHYDPKIPTVVAPSLLLGAVVDHALTLSAGLRPERRRLFLSALPSELLREGTPLSELAHQIGDPQQLSHDNTKGATPHCPLLSAPSLDLAPRPSALNPRPSTLNLSTQPPPEISSIARLSRHQPDPARDLKPSPNPATPCHHAERRKRRRSRWRSSHFPSRPAIPIVNS